MANDDESFHEALKDLINRNSRENASNTPDFILARYMSACLQAFETGLQQLDAWKGNVDNWEGTFRRGAQIVERDGLSSGLMAAIESRPQKSDE